MSWARPKKQVDELAAQLDAAIPGDFAATHRLYYKLSNLNRAKPGDHKTLVSLAQAALAIGKKSDASEFAASLLRIHGALDDELINHLAILLACLGDAEKAWDILFPRVHNDASGALLSNLGRIGLLLGDMDRMRQLADLEEKRGGNNLVALAAIQILDSNPNADFWSVFASTLRSLTRPYQVYASSGIQGEEENGEASLVYVTYVLASEVDRRALSRKIFDALEQAAVERGLEPAGLFPSCDFHILSLANQNALSTV